MAKTVYAYGTNPLHKIRAALVVLAVLVLAGTVGFMLIEDMRPLDALYMTVITLSTVGFGEVVPLHPMGKAFAIILILVSIGTVGAMVSFISQVMAEGQFRELVVRRKMENKLNKLNDHYIIAGFGRVGRQVALEFAGKDIQFVVIESDTDVVEKVLAEDYLVYQGDATTEEALTEAGIERAHTLVSTLPQEAQNVYLTLTARHMNSDLSIIARADFEEGERKLVRAGANRVILPHILGGVRMAKAALQPNVVDFVEMTAMGEEGLSIEELVIPEDCWLIGKSLVESGLKSTYGVTIIGLKKTGEKMKINPGPQTSLDSGDVLVLLGDNQELEKLSRDIRG